MRERREADMMARRERLARHGFLDKVRIILRGCLFETHGFEQLAQLKRHRIKIPQRNIGVSDSPNSSDAGRIACREVVLNLEVPIR